MKMNRAVLTAVVILVLAVVGWRMFRRGSAERIDLLTRFETAQKDGPNPYTLVDATLAGVTKKAILAPSNGRVHFKIKVPDDGWLFLSLGLQPEAWDKEGDGVYFFAGISDGRAYEPLFTQTVNPFKNPAERRWIPVTIDLSAYAGEEMELVLNTRSSAPSQPQDPRNDLPLWGAPEVARR
jgi:hypothetical protein